MLVDGEQFRSRRSPLDRLRRTPIAALGYKLLYPSRFIRTIQARAMRAVSQPVSGRLPRKTVARHRRNHQIERIRRALAMRRGIRERPDNLQLLDDRTGPSVGDDQRQRIVMFRMKWMK